MRGEVDELKTHNSFLISKLEELHLSMELLQQQQKKNSTPQKYMQRDPGQSAVFGDGRSWAFEQSHLPS
jgi:hypothetical protein